MRASIPQRLIPFLPLVLTACFTESPPSPVASVSINPDPVTVLECQTKALTASVTLENGQPSSAAVQWSVNDPLIASVDGQGALTGKAEGTTRVTATAGGKTGEASVAVSKNSIVSGIEVSAPASSVVAGQTLKFDATLKNECGRPVSGTVSWSVSDATKAGISSDGLLATNAGTQGPITVSASIGEKTKSLAVTIKNPTSSPNQRQLKLAVTSGSTPYGYLRYLPQDWGEDPHKRYPLLIFLHGIGEKAPPGGGVSTADLDKILTSSEGGPAYWINLNQLDPGFVVVTPQLKDNGVTNQPWDNAIIQAVIDKAKAEFLVDPKRVYLTGVSLGGGGVWYFAAASKSNADQLAAIASLDGSERGNTYANAKACNIASSKLPTLAYHSNSEVLNEFVKLVFTERWVNDINGVSPSTCTAPTPAARLERALDVNHYGIAAKVFNPAYRVPGDGTSVYDWLLQFSR